MRNVVYILSLLFFMVSCRSYYDVMQDYHADLDAHDFKGAEKALLKSRFLSKKRNKILLYLELGRTLHLHADYDSSNYYFNQADLLMDEKTQIADASKSVLVNEAITRYKGEDFERVLIHYYKALNYLYLGQNDDALVEAKRINLRLNEIGDKTLWQGRKYKSDALAHLLQAFVYEKLNNYNDAFIAYRNAYELYLKKDSGEYLGSPVPMQLKVDLINAAHKSGFYGERDEYCKAFGLPFESVKDTAKANLIFIWENGLAPVKEQEDIFLFLVKGAGGVLSFSDKSGNITIPIVLPDKDKEKLALSDLQTIHVAFPKYVDVPLYFNYLNIRANGENYRPELTENVAFIARLNLRERFLKEMTYTVSRVTLRKLAELELAKKNEAAGALVGIAGLFVEKADTRNWQSLPAEISYTRVPLVPGRDNKLVLQLNSAMGPSKTDTLVVPGNNKLHFLNYNTLQHLPPAMNR